MPISAYLAAKWDAKLYNWYLWKHGEGGTGSDGVSSIYDPGEWQGRSGYRGPGNAVLSGEAQDTDALMLHVQRIAPTVYNALHEWARNYGTRGAQAARLSIHQDTYRDKVDSGMRMLEDLSISRYRHGIKARAIAIARG